METQSSHNSKRILIAEDDPSTMQYVSSIVEKEGYKVVKAQNGREAIKILNSDADFSAAIFDMMMPHLQGIDVIRHMQTEKRLMRIPVIMMTAEKDPRIMPEAFSSGALIFLTKPFTSPQLIAMLSIIANKKAE
jgi:CheY-like chemotaxis protein